MVTEFKISSDIKIVGKSQSTRNGFRHIVEYYKNNNLVESRSVSYLNRTWESYEYETAISLLLEKMIKQRMITQPEAVMIKKITSGQAKANLDAKFGMIGSIAMMGDVFHSDLKSKNEWKLRMIKTGLGNGISIPDDWDSLSEEEKGRRLDLIIAQMKR